MRNFKDIMADARKYGLPIRAILPDGVGVEDTLAIHEKVWREYLCIQKIERFSGPTNFIVDCPSGASGYGPTLVEALIKCAENKMVRS